MADKFDGKVVLELEVDAKTGKAVISKVNTELGKTDKHLKNINKRSKMFFTHFQKSLIVLNQAAELFRKIAQFAQVIVKPIQEAGQFEQYRMVLKNLIGDIDEADRRFREMVEFAAKTPFNVPGIVEAGNRLEALGKYSLDTIRNLGDLAAASGKDVMQAVEAYTNLVTGRTGIAIKQFRAMLISTRDWERQIGKSVLKTGKGIKASITEMLEALPEIIAQKNFAGLMEEQAKTLLGMMSNLEDNFQQVMAGIGETFLNSTKGMITWLIDVLDWVKVNIDALMKGIKELGNLILWLVGAAVFGSMIKGFIRIGRNINMMAMSLRTATWNVKNFTKNIRDMGKVSAISMGGILGLIGVIGMLISMMSTLRATVHRTTDDMIRFEEQNLANNKILKEEAEATRRNAVAKKELLTEYIRLVKQGDKLNRTSEEWVKINREVKRLLPNLAAGTYKTSEEMSKLTEELDDATDAADNAADYIKELIGTIDDLNDSLNRLEIRKTFGDLIKELTEGGGVGDAIGEAVDYIMRQLILSADQMDNTADDMVESFFNSIADGFSDIDNTEDLGIALAKMVDKINSDTGLLVIDRPRLEDFVPQEELDKLSDEDLQKYREQPKSQLGKGGENIMPGDKDVFLPDEFLSANMSSIEKYARQVEVYKDAITKGNLVVKEGSEEAKRVNAVLMAAYTDRIKQIQNAEITDMGGIVSALESGLGDVKEKLKYSDKASFEVMEEYKKILNRHIEQVDNFDEELKEPGGLKIGKALFKLLPLQEEREDTEYNAFVTQQADFIIKNLADELQRVNDAIEDKEKANKAAFDTTEKERRKWLKEWKDKRKQLDAELAIDVVDIESSGNTEEQKSKALISAKIKYQNDIMELERGFNTEFTNLRGLEYAKRNGEEKKFTADNKKVWHKQTEDQIELYIRMYEQNQRMRDLDQTSVKEYVSEIDEQMTMYKEIITASLGDEAIGLKFDELSTEQLQKVAPAFLEFLTKLKLEAQEANSDLSELMSAELSTALLSNLNELNTTSLDGFVGELNDVKDMILLNGMAVDELREKVKQTDEGVDLDFAGVNTLGEIEVKTEILAKGLDDINTKRMTSINLIEDEDQRSIARYTAEKINLENLSDLYLLASTKLGAGERGEGEEGEGFTEEEMGMTEDDRIKHKAMRIQLASEYKSEYLNILGLITEAEVSEKQFILDLDAAMWHARLGYASQFVNQMQGVTDALMKQAEQSASAYAENWKKAQFSRIDREEKHSKRHARTRQQETRIEEIYAANKEAIELEAQKKKYERLKGWFNLQKALEITQIAINTAGAWVKNFELFGYPLGLGMNVLTTAAAVAQAALVASKQMPGMEFKEGGYTGEGGVNEPAGVVHKKEFVLDETTTKIHRDLIEKLHKGDLTKEEEVILEKIGDGTYEKNKKGFRKGGYTGDDDKKSTHKEFVINNESNTNKESVKEPDISNKSVIDEGLVTNNESTKELVNSTNSLVGKNSVVDIRRDIQLSKVVIDSNGMLVNQMKEFKNMMKQYLDNPVPSKAYLNDREAKKITSKGIQKIRREGV